MPFYHMTTVMFMTGSHGTRNLGINDRDRSGYMIYALPSLQKREQKMFKKNPFTPTNCPAVGSEGTVSLALLLAVKIPSTVNITT